MSTKFFNNTETRLMDKFHGIASAMANFDIFHAVVGYFRSSGYFKLRKELENVRYASSSASISTISSANRNSPVSFFSRTKKQRLNSIARTSFVMSTSPNTRQKSMKASVSSALTLPTIGCNCVSIPPKTFMQSSIYVCRKAIMNIATAGSSWVAATSAHRGSAPPNRHATN